MSKNGILKFLNPGRVKLPTLSKVLSKKLFGGLAKVPGTNMNSNYTVKNANKSARENKRIKNLTKLVSTPTPIALSKEELDYWNWKQLSPEQQNQIRDNKARAYLDSGPNITNFWNAFRAYIGDTDPKNPYLNIGIVNVPGRATPLLVQLSVKLMETINNYWNKLGKLKIRLGGSGKYAPGILTKPGTAPTTFNGLNISYITSPKGGNVTHKFYTDLGSEYILTKDGFARRIKTPHANTGGVDAGLHEWNLGKTYFLDDKGNFSGQFRLIKEKVPNVAVAIGKDGKMYFMNVDTNKLILNEEIFPKAVEKGILSKGYYNIPYSQEPRLGYSLFEFGTNGTTGKINWYHPGSLVAFIEGLKQGGKMNILLFLKNGSGIHIKKKNRGKFTDYCGGKVTDACIRRAKASGNPTLVKRATFAANARKWKH